MTVEAEELLYDESLDDPTVWSVTRLRTIESCGKQYEFRYVTKAPAVQTAYLAFGKTMHRVIEEIHKAQDFTDTFWQQQWSERWFEAADEVVWSGFNKSQFNNSGPKMLQNYVDANREVKILELESAFPAFKIGEFVTRGVLDQVRRTEGGRLLVVDLKTSKYPPDPLILRADPQFTIYHAVAKEKYGEEPLLALYHLESGKMFYTTRTDEDIKGVEAMLKQAKTKVDAELFERNVTTSCRYCPYLEQCLQPNESSNLSDPTLL